MKVLFISHGPNLDGGAERVLMNIIEGLDRKKIQPIVVVPRKGQFSKRLESLGIPYYVIPQFWMIFAGANPILLIINAFLNISSIQKIRKIIISEQIDVVYTNSIVIFAGGIAAKLEGIPHIWHLHELVFANPNLHFGFGRKILQAILYTFSDQIIAVSKAVLNDLGLEEGKNIAIIPNGLKPSAWDSPDAVTVERIRQELGIHSKAKVLIFVGTQSACKMPEKAVETLANLKRKDVFLLMVGNPGEPITQWKLKSLIARKNLHHQVIFTGFRPDLPNLFALADIALVPSLFEAWGLATVEAMAAGLPVVAGSGGNNLELILDGKTGYLVPKSDPKLMAKKVETLLAHPELRKKMGTLARQTSRCFTCEAQLEKITKILLTVEALPKKKRSRPLKDGFSRFSSGQPHDRA